MELKEVTDLRAYVTVPLYTPSVFLGNYFMLHDLQIDVLVLFYLSPWSPYTNIHADKNSW